MAIQYRVAQAEAARRETAREKLFDDAFEGTGKKQAGLTRKARKCYELRTLRSAFSRLVQADAFSTFLEESGLSAVESFLVEGGVDSEKDFVSKSDVRLSGRD